MTNKEITQIPKSESKKFSILCTFKLPLTAELEKMPIRSGVLAIFLVLCSLQCMYSNSPSPLKRHKERVLCLPMKCLWLRYGTFPDCNNMKWFNFTYGQKN
jgi:hypothetical protein